MFGDYEPLDNGWVQEYLQRHPNAKICVGKPIEESARTCIVYINSPTGSCLLAALVGLYNVDGN